MACVAKTAADLPALPVQYADFAVWQRSNLQRRGVGAATGLLEGGNWAHGLRPLDLPTDFARPAVQTYRGAKRTQRLSKRT